MLLSEVLKEEEEGDPRTQLVSDASCSSSAWWSWCPSTDPNGVTLSVSGVSWWTSVASKSGVHVSGLCDCHTVVTVGVIGLEES